MTTITRDQAEQVLAAVKARWAAYLEPLALDDGAVLSATYPEPTLVEDYDGAPWAILWEEGPDDWTYHLDGSPSEEDQALMAAASAEFGVDLKSRDAAPAEIPADVHVEPIMSFVLGIYS